MAALPESSTWEPQTYQLETSDRVKGGSGGTSNIQATQLGNRTKYLLDDKIDKIAIRENGVGQKLVCCGLDNILDDVLNLRVVQKYSDVDIDSSIIPPIPYSQDFDITYNLDGLKYEIIDEHKITIHNYVPSWFTGSDSNYKKICNNLLFSPYNSTGIIATNTNLNLTDQENITHNVITTRLNFSDGLICNFNNANPSNQIIDVSTILPECNSLTDGTFTLQCTITSGVKVYSWVEV